MFPAFFRPNTSSDLKSLRNVFTETETLTENTINRVGIKLKINLNNYKYKLILFYYFKFDSIVSSRYRFKNTKIR